MTGAASNGQWRRAGRSLGFLLLIGGLFFLVGTYQTSDPTDIVCDGQQMGPGDICFGNTEDSGTYEELVAERIERERSKPAQRPYLVIAVAIGATLVIVTTVAGRPSRPAGGQDDRHV